MNRVELCAPRTAVGVKIAGETLTGRTKVVRTRTRQSIPAVTSGAVTKRKRRNTHLREVAPGEELHAKRGVIFLRGSLHPALTYMLTHELTLESTTHCTEIFGSEKRCIRRSTPSAT